MKINTQFKGIFQWIMALAIIIGLASCTKTDVSDPFVEGGEFTYPAKADSVLARGGKNRLELSWLLVSDPKITKYKVYWNNRRDSLEGLVQRTSAVDTIRLKFNDMAEGIYNFEIYTYDKNNNRSVKATAIGKVYGDFYQNTLLTRAFKTVSKFEDYYQINWMDAEDQFASAVVEYKDKNGATVKVVVDKKDIRTKLANIKAWGAEFSYVSKFLPEPLALDTFYAKPVVHRLPEFSWKNYPLIFGHFGDLMAQDENGDLFKFVKKADGTFGIDQRVLSTWNAKIAFSHKNDLISILPNGVIMRTPMPLNGATGTPAQISTGWQIFDKVVGVQNGFIARKISPAADIGKLNYYGFNPAGNGSFSGNKLLYASGYNVYDAIVYVSSGALIARKPTGELYRISVDATGTLGSAVLIAQGWDQFEYISSNGNTILVRKTNGELWSYPMNGSVLGAPQKIVNEIG